VKRLRSELDDVMSNPKVLPDISTLNELSYLNAFMKEGKWTVVIFPRMNLLNYDCPGLRLYTAAPSLLERVVPSSTSKHSDEIFDMMGYALPPGTIVATQAWSMHRDPSVFPFPDTFLPERWLESSSTTQDDLSRMASHMMPFGAGTRVCGGQNLALMMLKLTVVAFVQNFDIRAPAETNERSMEIKDSFVRRFFIR